MALSTLLHGAIPSMPMTESAMSCAAPVLPTEFERCRIPGGVDFWTSGGFYSPGVCFAGYSALCTQTTASSGGWPIQAGETAVRCVPKAYKCNAEGEDQRFAVSDFAGTVLSAPAFEIRWRGVDLKKTAAGLLSSSTSRWALPSETVTVSESTDAITGAGIASTLRAGTTSSSEAVVESAAVPTTAVGHGYIAAIVVGVVAVLLIAGALIGLCVNRRRRKSSKEGRRADHLEPVEYTGSQRSPVLEMQPAEMDSMPMGPRELPPTPIDRHASQPTAAAHVSGVFEMAAEQAPNAIK